MNNLTVRLLTAAVGLVALFVFLYVLPSPSFYFLVLAVIAGCAYELFQATMAGDRAAVTFGVLGAVAVSIAFYFAKHEAVWAAAVAAVPVASLGFVLARPEPLAGASSRAAAFAFGTLYTGVLLTFVAFLYKPPFGPAWVMLALSVTWVGDTSAYFVGRAWGRRKMYEAVSPKKTWEGAAGGLAGSLLTAIVFHLFFLPELTLLDAVLVGLGAGALEQAGDLCESMLKRGAGVKDSGGLLPGHGGLLDRVDGLMFAAPFVYVYATLVA